MKNKTFFFLALPFILFATNIIAQDFSCTATYKTSSNIQMTMDSTSMPDKQQADLSALINKSMEKEYQLVMNKSESLYTQIVKLKSPTEQDEIEVIGLGIVTEGGVYKNIIENQLVETKDCFGKLFLVNDSLEHFNWELVNETKVIEQYTCYKAIYSEIKTINTIAIDSIGKPMEQEKTITSKTIAWYAPEIPLNHGPAGYWGLPGLILQIESDQLTITCSEIIFEQGKEMNIEKPKKGKSVTKEQYNEIYKAKVKEWIEMNDNEPDRRDF